MNATDHDPRRTQLDGLYTHVRYTSATLEGESRLVSVVLLDMRYNKDPYKTLEGDFLGAAQWAWLEQVFRSNHEDGVDLTLLGSSLQLLPGERLECRARFPSAQQRLIDLMAKYSNPYLVLSGDVHFAELGLAKCAGGGQVREEEGCRTPVPRATRHAPLIAHRMPLRNFATRHARRRWPR